jgi:hypothetical protein
MSLRPLIDTILHPNGAPWVDAAVTFELITGSYTASAAYPADGVTVKTGATGGYRVLLWCDEEGVQATQYRATYPDGATFLFDLPVGDGSPVAMSSLRTTVASQVTAAANLQSLIDAAIGGVGGAGAVDSVNTQIGVVVLGAADVGADVTGTAADLVAAEATARATADTTNATAVTTEATARSTADTTLQTTIASEATARATADSDHAGAADPHPGYLTPAEGNAAYRAIGYVPAWSEITSKPTTIAGYGITDVYTKTQDDARFAPIAVVGSVTSVGLTVPGVLFSVTGSPITGAGTLALSLLTQAANTVLAGPATGIAATPTMRALVAADTPAAAILAAANTFTLAQGIRVAASGQAAGLYVPWVTGDALATLKVGALTTGNNQIGLYVESKTERAIYAETTSGSSAIQGVAATNVGVTGQGVTGVRAIGTTAFGILTSATSGSAVYADTTTGTPLYGVRNGALTSATGPLLKLEMGSSGTPAGGFGGSIDFLLKSSTTLTQSAAQISTFWPDAAGATHATRSGAVSVSTVSIAGALAERLRIDAGVVAGAAVATTVGLMVWDVDSGALKRVSVGANDSGGAGYKLLRIAN